MLLLTLARLYVGTKLRHLAGKCKCLPSSIVQPLTDTIQVLTGWKSSHWRSQSSEDVAYSTDHLMEWKMHGQAPPDLPPKKSAASWQPPEPLAAFNRFSSFDRLLCDLWVLAYGFQVCSDAVVGQSQSSYIKFCIAPPPQPGVVPDWLVR